MKNRNRIYRTTALLMILMLLLSGVSGGADENDAGDPAAVYSGWLRLDELLGNQQDQTAPLRGDRSGTEYSSDLADFLYDIEIAGAEMEGGQYVIHQGVPYTIQLKFREKTNGIQFDDGPDAGVWTYRFPAGFTPVVHDSMTGRFRMGDGENAVWLDYVITEETLTVTVDQTSLGYQAFRNSENVEFEIHADGIINRTEIEFSDQVSGEFRIDDSSKVNVRKFGRYDVEMNKVIFTIQAYSTGINNNVHIGDIITGTALTYDEQSGLIVSSNKTDPVDYEMGTRAGETFGLDILSMTDGEIVTVEYYADVNLSGLTPTGNGRYGTVEQTGNRVEIYSDQDHPGDHDTIYENDFQNNIVLSSNSKTVLSQEVRGEKTYVTWKIVLNENANMSIAGSRVTDTIDASSQPFMRYAGAGIHIERYEKDGTPAGTSDIGWGTNGLSASHGGSTWTYTIPDSDREHQYRYVITYETEVDSDAFLTKTDVGNEAHNEYDRDYGSVGVETTGEKVDAAKKALESHKNPENNETETEWEITFTVPPEGLRSAVITDTMPAIRNPEDNGFFYDTYKEESVDCPEGLLPGESYTVDSSQAHQVIITFARSNGEPGLDGTGQTRTIRVRLTTIASQEWLEYAESNSRAKTHVNNAIVRVNGQKIDVQGTVSYNTAGYDLEKVLGGTYSTKDGLPIYVYKIILSNLNDDAFDSGYLTITDHFDSEYLIYRQTYDTYDGYNVNTPNGRVYGNNRDNPGAMQFVGPYVVDPSSSDGRLVFRLNKDTLPRDGSSYWPYYAIYYALQVRDAETLERMKYEALHSDGLSVKMENTAANDRFGTDTIVTEYTIKALEKKYLDEKDNTDTGTHELYFSIDVNPEGLRIGDEDMITVRDTITNLSFDYTSISISPMIGGETLNRVGNSIIFRLHNETHYTITYTARLIGFQNVQWNNKAELFGYVSAVNGKSTWHSGGSGSFANYSMNIKKYADGNMNQGLAATFELYEARVKDASGNNIPEPVWRKVRIPMTEVFTTDEETGIYRINSVIREDETEAKSLRPYSYHDTNGNEQFGNDESETYGWRYRVIEIEPPPGYQKIFDVYEFGISDIPSYTAPYNYLNDDTVTIVNKPIPSPADTVVEGQKTLIGKELEDQEFAFSLRPEESILAAWGGGYPGGFDGSLTAWNNAEGRFSFQLSYTYEDYQNAVQKGFADENRCAYFYYVVTEEIPQQAEDNFWNGVRYDAGQFLVQIRLFPEGNRLLTENRYYQYDGNGIPDRLLNRLSPDIQQILRPGTQ